MLQNYVIISLRNIFKNRLFSLINICGLAIGLAIFLLTNVLGTYERNYDRFFAKSERIHLPHVMFVPGGPVGVRSGPSVQSAAKVHLEAMPGVEKVARSMSAPFVAKTGDKKFYQRIRFLDDEFFEIFDFDFIAGDGATALGDANSVILSESTADRYFGDAPAVGQVITIDAKHDLKVTGIFRDLPTNSHFTSAIIGSAGFEMAASMAANTRMTGFDPAGTWNNLSSNEITYMLLAKDTDPASLAPALDTLIPNHAPAETQEFVQTIRMRHLSAMNLYPWEASGIPVITAIQVIGVLILFVAVLNYTNLATAQAMGRAREIGIRKTVGARKVDLFGQFIVEAIALTTIAALLAVAILETGLPMINNALDRDISFDIFGDLSNLTFLIGAIVVTGTLAGAYPATVLARMKVVKVLSGSMRAGRGSAMLRSVLLGLQFLFAVVLTSLVFVINAQNEKLSEAASIFDRDRTLNLHEIRDEMVDSYDTLRLELAAIPGVEMVSGTSQVPFQQDQAIRELGRTRADEDKLQFLLFNIDEAYFDIHNLTMAAGRNVSRDRGDLFPETEEGEDQPELMNIIVNELAVTKLGFASPEAALGEAIYSPSPENTTVYRVVGVVENRDFIGLFSELKPMLFSLRPGRFDTVAVKISAGAPTSTVTRVEEVWDSVYPEFPITRRFLEEEFQSTFELFEAINMVLAGLAGMAVVLSALGLFGLAAFIAEKRTKEIGIRKVLGASTAAITRLLVWQFSLPVVVAIVIGTPIAFFASQVYLDFFSNRIELGPLLFAGSALFVLLLAWVSVGGQAIKVARSNPVFALRYE